MWIFLSPKTVWTVKIQEFFGNSKKPKIEWRDHFHAQKPEKRHEYRKFFENRKTLDLGNVIREAHAKFQEASSIGNILKPRGTDARCQASDLPILNIRTEIWAQNRNFDKVTLSNNTEFRHAENGNLFTCARLIRRPNNKSEAARCVHLWNFEIRGLDALGTACNIVQLRYTIFLVIGTATALAFARSSAEVLHAKHKFEILFKSNNF